MIDAKALLDRFLGAPGATGQPPASGSPWGAPRPGPGAASQFDLGDTARQVLGRVGGVGGVAAAGGLLAVLLSGKKRRGGLLSHGGAAVLGALAHRAWQNWQSGQPPAAAPVAGPQDAAAVDARFLPGSQPLPAGTEPFELSLIRAMIGAARADGHIDAQERGRIFEHVEKAGLDPEAKAFVFDTIDAPIGVREVAAGARSQEQAAELYLASRLAMDPDEPAERAYLQALAHRLQLPADLVAHLDRQADAAG